MLEQKLKSIWRNSSKAEQIKFDLSRLLIELNTKMRNFESTIRRRDRREIVASIIGIVLFSYLAYDIPYILSKSACFFGVGWFFYVIYRLRKNGVRDKEDLSVSYREQVLVQKSFLQKQAHMLDSVLYWYVLPPFIVNVTFVLGLGDPTMYDWSPTLVEMLPFSLKSKIVHISIVALMSIYIVYINRKAVRVRYNPMIRELERMERQLEE